MVAFSECERWGKISSGENKIASSYIGKGGTECDTMAINLFGNINS
jgi:hypothetical protein